MGSRQIEIHSLGPLGDGVSGRGKSAVFVAGALPGDTVTAKVRRDLHGVSRGEIVRVQRPSAVRRKAPCPQFEACGNCTLQHATPDFYRRWKQDRVTDALAKAGVSPKSVVPPVFVGEGSRRRATLTAQRSRTRTSLGYYQRRTQRVQHIHGCAVLHPKLDRLRHQLRPVLDAVVPMDGRLDFFFQVAGDQVELGVTGKYLDLDPLVTWAKQQGILRLSVRPRANLPFRPHWQNGNLTVEFGSLPIQLPPGAFLQPTEAGERALVEAVLSALPSEGNFADLFAGCGTFTGHLLERGKVHAFETDPAAVRTLARAARGRSLKAFERDLFTHPLTPGMLNRYDAVVLDPPRAGCPEQARELASSLVPLVVSVSCNPATFARDARLLTQGGYKLQRIHLVDQFVHSHHVEVVGIFRKT